MSSRFLVAVAIITFISATAVFGQVWQEGFEDGVSGAAAYHSEAPNTQLEARSDGAAEGESYLHAELPGERSLEGFRVQATGIPGDRLVTVTAQIRGAGKAWMFLKSANGWLYGPRSVELSDRWQEISLSKALEPGRTYLSIYFISRKAGDGSVYEVDDVRVTAEQPLQTWDEAVASVKFEAENFPQDPANIDSVYDSSGFRALSGKKYFAATGLPFPRTARPVSIYARVQAPSEKDRFSLVTRQPGVGQRLQTLKPEKSGEWHWLQFDPVTAGVVGDAFEIQCRQDKASVEPAAIDCVVISTDADIPLTGLQDAPPALASFPMAAVGRCDTPPTIDGVDGDVCWSRTVSCSNFLQIRSLAPAVGDTIVRLCYDDENLYATFGCLEPMLDPVKQQRHEFVARAEEHDGDVYRDEAVALLVDPDGDGRHLYDIAVNALGTVADAKCTGPDYWKSRDKSWESGAVAAGTIGDDAWIAEVKIPFEELGGPPSPGDRWKVTLARVARARSEKSSWNPSGSGFHAPEVFGVLEFCDEVPDVVVLEPQTVNPGTNALNVALQGEAPPPLLITSRLLGSKASVYDHSFMPGDEERMTHEFAIPDEGDWQIAHMALDAVSLKPLYVTANVERAVTISRATLTLASDGPYSVHVNGMPAATGQEADGGEIEISLADGPNVIAVEAENGAIAAQIEAPGMPAQSVRWKLAPTDAENVLQPDTADSRWETAPVVKEHRALGAYYGKDGEPTVLRHTVLWDNTRLWPLPDPALYIARNTAQHMNIVLDVPDGRRFDGWTTYLAIPEGFEFLGAAGYYGEYLSYQPKYECENTGSKEVLGQQMNVWKITADKTVAPGRHWVMYLLDAFVRCNEDSPDQATLAYWSEANDGTISEPLQEIPVRALPGLQGQQPQELTWQLWGSYFNALNRPELRLATLQTMQDAGMTDLVAGDAWTGEHASSYGITNTWSTSFKSSAINMSNYLKAHPEDRLIGTDGKPSDQYVCMTRLLGDAWEVAEGILAEEIEKRHLDRCEYDFEEPAFYGPHSCYCPRCLAAFREEADISADVELTPEIIRRQYRQEWLDFMAHRAAELFVRFSDSIHRIDPDVKFSIYSGYQTPENVERYGVDWALVGQRQACDDAGCGYGRHEEYVNATVEALQGIPLLCGALLRPDVSDSTQPLRPLTKARMIRRSLDATGGALVCNRFLMDGRCWRAVAETTRLVAQYEELFAEARPQPVSDFNPAIVCQVSDGETTLVCAMNDTGKQVTHTIPLPADAGGGVEFYSGTQVTAGQPVECTLPPGEAAVYVLKP
ncbi:MAG: carbohydrate-binding family 9-like protein [Armatimonadota bacterium]